MFGWGTRQKSWALADGQQLLLVYKYFHLFFIFRVASDQKWFLIGNDRREDREISVEQVRVLFPANTPSLNLWERYSLFLLIAASIVLAFLP